MLDNNFRKSNKVSDLWLYKKQTDTARVNRITGMIQVVESYYQVFWS